MKTVILQDMSGTQSEAIKNASSSWQLCHKVCTSDIFLKALNLPISYFDNYAFACQLPDSHVFQFKNSQSCSMAKLERFVDVD